MSVEPTYEELQGRIATLEKEAETCRRMQQAALAERRQILELFKGFPAYICLEAEDHTFRYTNDFFRERFGDPEGRSCADALGGDSASVCPVADILRTMAPRTWEWHHEADAVTYRVYAYPFPGDGHSEPQVLELGLDITLPRLADRDRQLLVEELQAATEKLKLLQSIVPVCSCCHRLRSDEPYWRRIDEYLAMEEAWGTFAPGLCQTCRQRYFHGLEK